MIHRPVWAVGFGGEQLSTPGIFMSGRLVLSVNARSSMQCEVLARVCYPQVHKPWEPQGLQRQGSPLLKGEASQRTQGGGQWPSAGLEQEQATLLLRGA